MSTNKKFRIQNGVDITGEVVVGNQLVITAEGKLVLPAITEAVNEAVATDIAALQAQVDAILGTSPEHLDTLQEIVALFQSEDGDISTLITNNSTAITQIQQTLASGVATAAQGALADTAAQQADLDAVIAQITDGVATAAQGALADTAVQPEDFGAGILTVSTTASDLSVQPSVSSVVVSGNTEFFGSPGTNREDTFVTNGTVSAISSGAGVTIFDTTTGDQLHFFQGSSSLGHSGSYISGALAINSTTLFVVTYMTSGGANNAKLHRINLSDGTYQSSTISADLGDRPMDMALRGNYLYLSARGPKDSNHNRQSVVLTFDITTGSQTNTVTKESPSGLWGVSLAIEGNFLAVSNTGAAELTVSNIPDGWETSGSTNLIYKIQKPLPTINFALRVEISDSKLYVYSIESMANNIGYIHVYDVTDGSLITSYSSETAADNFGADFSVMGTALLVSEMNGDVATRYLLDLSTDLRYEITESFGTDKNGRFTNDGTSFYAVGGDSSNRVYTTVSPSGSTSNEYSVDTSVIATKDYVDSGVAGVDLSAYSTTAEMDSAIAAIPATDLTPYSTSSEMTSAIATAKSEAQTYADQVVAATVDAAPAALDTLNELAAALGDDANFASTVTASIATKADDAATTAALATKADDAATTAALATKADDAATTAALDSKADGSVVSGIVDYLNGVEVLPQAPSKFSLLDDPQPQYALNNAANGNYSGFGETIKTYTDYILVSHNDETSGLNQSGSIFIYDRNDMENPVELYDREFTWNRSWGNTFYYSETSKILMVANHDAGSDNHGSLQFYDLTDLSNITKVYQHAFPTGQGANYMLGAGSGYDEVANKFYATRYGDTGNSPETKVGQLFVYDATNITATPVEINPSDLGLISNGPQNYSRDLYWGRNMSAGGGYVYVNDLFNRDYTIIDTSDNSLVGTLATNYTEYGVVIDDYFAVYNNSDTFTFYNKGTSDIAFSITTPDSGSGRRYTSITSVGNYYAIPRLEGGLHWYDKSDTSTVAFTNVWDNYHVQWTYLSYDSITNQLYVTDYFADLDSWKNPTYVRQYDVSELGSAFNAIETAIANIPSVDLSDYSTTAQMDSAIAAIPSTDLTPYSTTVEMDSAIAVETAARTAAIAAIPATDLTPYSTTVEMGSAIATAKSEAQSYADQVVAATVDAAPAALDTLNELAAALGDDANFASTVTDSIATKADDAATTAALASKVGIAEVDVRMEPIKQLAESAIQPEDFGTGIAQTTTAVIDFSVEPPSPSSEILGTSITNWPNITTNDLNGGVHMGSWEHVLTGRSIDIFSSGRTNGPGTTYNGVQPTVYLTDLETGTLIESPQGTQGSGFGEKVAFNDGYMVVSAHNFENVDAKDGSGNSLDNISEGAVYVYKTHDQWTVTLHALLQGNDYTGDYKNNWDASSFGDNVVLIDGTSTAIISDSKARDINGENEGGRVLLIDVEDGSIVKEFTNPSYSDGGRYIGRFGKTVKVSGDTVFIGAGGRFSEGSIHQFSLSTGSLIRSYQDPYPEDLSSDSIQSDFYRSHFSDTFEVFGNYLLVAQSWYGKNVYTFDHTTGYLVSSERDAISGTHDYSYGYNLVSKITDNLVAFAIVGQPWDLGNNYTWYIHEISDSGVFSPVALWSKGEYSSFNPSSNGTIVTTIASGGRAGSSGTVQVWEGVPSTTTNYSVDTSLFATKDYVDSGVAGVDLSDYSTTAEMDSAIAAIPATDLTPYSTTAQMDSAIAVETGARETAVTSAISTASDDATAKANAAQAAAEATAAADATAKADAAQAAAIAAAGTAATQAIAATVDAAPASLDTLNELAAALGDDANFASTVTASIATKADADATAASIASKVGIAEVDIRMEPIKQTAESAIQPSDLGTGIAEVSSSVVDWSSLTPSDFVAITGVDELYSGDNEIKAVDASDTHFVTLLLEKSGGREIIIALHLLDGTLVKSWSFDDYPELNHPWLSYLSINGNHIAFTRGSNDNLQYSKIYDIRNIAQADHGLVTTITDPTIRRVFVVDDTRAIAVYGSIWSAIDTVKVHNISDWAELYSYDPMGTPDEADFGGGYFVTGGTTGQTNQGVTILKTSGAYGLAGTVFSTTIHGPSNNTNMYANGIAVSDKYVVFRTQDTDGTNRAHVHNPDDGSFIRSFVEESSTPWQVLNNSKGLGKAGLALSGDMLFVPTGHMSSDGQTRYVGLIIYNILTGETVNTLETYNGSRFEIDTYNYFTVSGSTIIDMDEGTTGAHPPILATAPTTSVVSYGVDTSVFATKDYVDSGVDGNEGRLTTAENNLTALEADLSAEENARGAGDTALGLRLDSDKSELDTALATETSGRIAGDSDLSASISAEETDRIAGDASLQSAIDALTGSSNDAISSETTARTTAVANETADRIAGDSDLQSAIDAEISRATSAESGLQSQISNVLSNTDATALNSLAEIVTEFQNADSTLGGVVGGHGTRLTDLEGRTTDNIPEGITNKYYSDDRVKTALSGGLCINDTKLQATGEIAVDEVEAEQSLRVAEAVVSDDTSKLEGQGGSHYRIDIYDVNGVIIND